MANFYDTNKNATIRSRRMRNGKFRTETARRDSGLSASISTDPRRNSTQLSVTSENGLVVRLGGRQARTLFRLLANHYDYTGKSFNPIVSRIGA